MFGKNIILMETIIVIQTRARKLWDLDRSTDCLQTCIHVHCTQHRKKKSLGDYFFITYDDIMGVIHCDIHVLEE